MGVQEEDILKKNKLYKDDKNVVHYICIAFIG